MIAQLFVPGHAFDDCPDGRTSSAVEHVLALSDGEVSALLGPLLDAFERRHRDLEPTLLRHAERISERLGQGRRPAGARALLLGATFTQETAVEPAALCNPSAFALPDQAGVAPGSLRFGLSVRQIGEGHRSSIGFRTGTLGADGSVTVDPTGPFTVAATTADAPLEQADLIDPTTPDVRDADSVAWVLDGLGPRFSADELDRQLTALERHHDTRRNTADVARHLRELAARTYVATFPHDSALVERVLLPATAAEANGIEDARFVRFVDDDGSVTFHATCTAYDGHDIRQQLLTTTDLRHFTAGPLLGSAAANKGLALFPRRVRGHFAALSRSDGASNSVAFTDDLRHWPTSTQLDCPTEPWEAIQVGNCGPPIETEAGWLVLTHGVGPMRSYALGAWLLDLEDPTRLIGRLRRPLLSPGPDEQDGYVPNVVYSCGSLLHASTLLVPFGIGDASIRFATVPLGPLLDELHAGI